MSHEHRALGYRPPPGSLAADAQAAAARHPNTSSGPAAATRITLKDEILREAAVRDAEKIRYVSLSFPIQSPFVLEGWEPIREFSLVGQCVRWKQRRTRVK